MVTTTMSEAEVRDGVQRLAPFHHDIVLPYGLRTHVPDLSRRGLERTRFATLVAHAFPTIESACGGSLSGLRILDVACNCGGFTIEAARRGAASVVGIDIVDRYLQQGRFLSAALGLTNIEMRKLAVEQLDESDIGTFDVTFCFGLLYHLENPILAMRQIAARASKLLVVDTNLLPQGRWERPRALWSMHMPPASNEAALQATTSLWRTTAVTEFTPTAHAVIEMLRFLGFARVVQLKPTVPGLEKRYYKGTRGTFLAFRNAA